MARLIDADELKKEITSAFHGALGVTITIAMHELIDKQPTIDPESLRLTAHWKYLSEVDALNYCSQCGAEMEQIDLGEKADLPPKEFV